MKSEYDITGLAITKAAIQAWCAEQNIRLEVDTETRVQPMFNAYQDSVSVLPIFTGRLQKDNFKLEMKNTAAAIFTELYEKSDPVLYEQMRPKDKKVRVRTWTTADSQYGTPEPRHLEAFLSTIECYIRRSKNTDFDKTDCIVDQSDLTSQTLLDVPIPPGNELAASEEDLRARVTRSIVARVGQGKFRSSLLSIFSKTCIVSECKTPWSLDAAHIAPYNGAESNAPSNGILLRSDLHNLFDLGLLSFLPVTDSSAKIIFHEEVRSDGTYGEYQGKLVHFPGTDTQRAARWRLARHYEYSILTHGQSMYL